MNDNSPITDLSHHFHEDGCVEDAPKHQEDFVVRQDLDTVAAKAVDAAEAKKLGYSSCFFEFIDQIELIHRRVYAAPSLRELRRLDRIETEIEKQLGANDEPSSKKTRSDLLDRINMLRAVIYWSVGDKEKAALSYAEIRSRTLNLPHWFEKQSWSEATLPACTYRGFNFFVAISKSSLRGLSLNQSKQDVRNAKRLCGLRVLSQHVFRLPSKDAWLTPVKECIRWSTVGILMVVLGLCWFLEDWGILSMAADFLPHLPIAIAKSLPPMLLFPLIGLLVHHIAKTWETELPKELARWRKVCQENPLSDFFAYFLWVVACAIASFVEVLRSDVSSRLALLSRRCSQIGKRLPGTFCAPGARALQRILTLSCLSVTDRIRSLVCLGRFHTEPAAIAC